MSQKYDYSVVIGRFNPCHYGHHDLLNFAISQSKKVIVLIGTANRPRTIKNPFKWTERQLMIESMYKDAVLVNELNTFIFKPLNDYMYNDQKWAIQVQNTIDLAIEEDGGDPDSASICLVGNNKDDSSWYLSIFPQFPLLTSPFKQILENQVLSATQIRKIMFESETNKVIDELSKHVHKGVLNYLKEFMKTLEFNKLVNEYHFIKQYKISWNKAPYPPTFVTTDAVVIQSGHVLLIQRRAEPGKGLWAFPGGFLNLNEKIETGMVRELKEETKIKIPEAVIRGSIKAVKTFDDPNRSERGRTITHAFLIKFPDGILPRIKGSDDAEKAKWIPLSDIKSDNMYEDHYDILEYFLGQL